MKGHRNIIDTEYRWEATMQIARDFGIQPTPERTVQLTTNSWSPQVGYEPTRQLTQATKDSTALVCFNDTAAIGAIRALHEAGLQVPRDVSVVGFDDILSAEFHVPSLTTIRQPLAHMGQLATRILLERIADPGKLYPPSILVKPQLVVRESTARVNKS
jgi:LacI family transcriptional regulator